MFSEKTKRRAAYWGKKLECPVDEDANYENTYVSRGYFMSISC
jgi:NCS1 family nucleobase:cation symporter-1